MNKWIFRGNRLHWDQQPNSHNQENIHNNTNLNTNKQTCQGWERKCVRTARSRPKGSRAGVGFLEMGQQAPSPPAVISPSGVWSGVPAEIEFDTHFGLKIWHLVATILITFVRINWPNFCEQYTETLLCRDDFIQHNSYLKKPDAHNYASLHRKKCARYFSGRKCAS